MFWKNERSIRGLEGAFRRRSYGEQHPNHRNMMLLLLAHENVRENHILTGGQSETEACARFDDGTPMLAV